jgi:hypothetical protein
MICANVSIDTSYCAGKNPASRSRSGTCHAHADDSSKKLQFTTTKHDSKGGSMPLAHVTILLSLLELSDLNITNLDSHNVDLRLSDLES